MRRCESGHGSRSYAPWATASSLRALNVCRLSHAIHGVCRPTPPPSCSYLSLLRRIARTSSFFFAAGGYDLTSSLQANDAAAAGSAGDAMGARRGAPVGTPIPNAGGAGTPAPSRRAAPLWATADPRFWWNAGASAAMVAAAAGGDAGAGAFISLVINGFVSACELREPGLGGPAPGAVTPGPGGAVRLLLVSRRGWSRQGTRFHVRGATSPDGSVANYAESEQLLLSPVDASAASYVQVRGSIPLLWEQSPTLKYTPRAVLTGGWPAALTAAQRHFASQTAVYGRVTAVNLIDRKGDQRVLGQAYEDAVAKLFATADGALEAAGEGPGGEEGASPATVAAAAAGVASAAAGAASALASSAAASAGAAPAAASPSPSASASLPSVGYVWFDFHAECRAMKWGNLSKLVAATSHVTDAYGWYGRDGRGCVARLQSGVLRTNCMDNLDRTNVVQSLFARRAALEALPGAWAATSACGCSVLTSPFPGFERAFNAAWADNADALSLLYSGTGALKTDFTRTGKRTLAGALSDGVNSVTRYVLNNLEDGRTQDAWDLFTGAYTPSRGHASHAHLGETASAATLTAAQAHAAGISAVSGRRRVTIASLCCLPSSASQQRQPLP